MFEDSVAQLDQQISPSAPQPFCERLWFSVCEGKKFIILEMKKAQMHIELPLRLWLLLLLYYQYIVIL